MRIDEHSHKNTVHGNDVQRARVAGWRGAYRRDGGMVKNARCPRKYIASRERGAMRAKPPSPALLPPLPAHNARPAPAAGVHQEGSGRVHAEGSYIETTARLRVARNGSEWHREVRQRRYAQRT